jgi:hypothetical protein
MSIRNVLKLFGTLPSELFSSRAFPIASSKPFVPLTLKETLTATSVADPSKQNSAPLTITSHSTLQVAAPSSLQPGVTAAIVATLTPAPSSNPSAVGPAEVSNAIASPCRNSTTTLAGPRSNPAIPGFVLGFSCSWVFLHRHPDRNGRSFLPRRSLARRPWSGGIMATPQLYLESQ